MKKQVVKRVLAVVLSASMILGGTVSALAATTDPTESQREIENKADARYIASQGMVLLENDGALPISDAAGTKVALYGQGVYNTIAGGTGSGAVNQRSTVTVQEAFEEAGYDIVNTDFIDEVHALWTADGGSTSGSGMTLGSVAQINERLYEEVEEGAVAKAAAKADTALYFITRNSGEGADRTATVDDYYLSNDEWANLALLGENFENVVVVLNIGGVMDTNAFNGLGGYPEGDELNRAQIPGIDAVLLMSQGGMTGANAVVDVLNGTVTPSGKLTDTWPINYEDNPSSEGFSSNDGNTNQEVYNDDIFVGYRYYDTWGVDVAYPFGSGMSYTDFTIETKSVTADADTTSVEVLVTNVGDVTGKEVVEVYFSAPEGELDKPYQELIGYAKTDDLAPGASQTLTVTFQTSEMGSYDTDRAAYIMEAGDYIIRVGDSSRNTSVAAKLSVDDLVITEQYSNLMVPAADDENKGINDNYPELDIISPKGVDPISYDGEDAQIAAAATIALDFGSYEPTVAVKENEDVTVYVSDSTETEYVIADVADGATAEISRTEAGNSNTADYTVSYNEHVEVLDGDFSDATLLDVYNGEITIEEFVSGLTLYEMANLVNGSSSSDAVQGVAGSSWENYEKGFVPFNMSDGPAGLRITQSYTSGGTTYYQYATAWPIGTLVAQTWDVDMIYLYGSGVGEEMEEFGIGCWLAPGMNIHRNPLNGRNFEYYSEDPLIVGTTGSYATLGVQSHNGVGVTIKHYALNSQENNRNSENNTVSERAIREIYVKGFEMVVKQAQPMAIMTSYNQNNGRPAANDYDLCTALPRGEWGYTGMIMTDWGGGQATPMYEMHAGNDLVMPGSGYSTIIAGFSADPDWSDDGWVNTMTVYYQDENYETQSYEVDNWGSYVLDVNGTTTVSTTVSGNWEEDPSILNDKVYEAQEAGYVESISYSEGSTGGPGGDMGGGDFGGPGGDMGGMGGMGGSASGTTVVYKVSLDTSSPTASQQISLGDVQKSAIRVCNTILKSIEFANYYGLEAESLDDISADILQTIMGSSKSSVKTSSSSSVALDKFMAMFTDLDASDYSAESWAAMQAAMDAAQAVIDDMDATQADYDAAIADLIAAFAGLEYGVEKLHLEVAIEAAYAILENADAYEGVSELQAALEVGEMYYASETSTQAMIDNAAYGILEAMSKLSIKSASSLQSLVDAAKKLLGGNYTEESLADLEAAIADAEDVLANASQDIDALNRAYGNLVNAILNLQQSGNKAALSAMLIRANAILSNADAYVASSIADLADVTARAQAVYDDSVATQSEIDVIVEELTRTVANARLIGDVNGDGVITTSDSAILLQYAAEMTALSSDDLASADVNGDGTADTSDAVLILQYVAEIITAF